MLFRQYFPSVSKEPHDTVAARLTVGRFTLNLERKFFRSRTKITVMLSANNLQNSWHTSKLGVVYMAFFFCTILGLLNYSYLFVTVLC